ncbi:MAG: hypothetical protein H7Y11_12930, partial [Armatimonadetes bacterium]|nr:hypothetical protein [Anaerolineae bacterium]
MATPRLARLFIEAMAKQLPPSASQLQLLDLGGLTGDTLTTLRPDVDITPVAGAPANWALPDECFDAVVGLDAALTPDALTTALAALRPGGRLILMDSNGEVTADRVQLLEGVGYTRILVESGIECPLPTGVLMRGEKPHTTDDTLARVQLGADGDADGLTLAAYR